MHHYEKIVHANPAGILGSFHVQGSLIRFFFEPFLNVVGNALHLRIAFAFTDDEKIGGSVVQFAQIKFQDVFSFNILNAVNDQVVQVFDGGRSSF